MQGGRWTEGNLCWRWNEIEMSTAKRAVFSISRHKTDKRLNARTNSLIFTPSFTFCLLPNSHQFLSNFVTFQFLLDDYTMQNMYPLLSCWTWTWHYIVCNMPYNIIPFHSILLLLHNFNSIFKYNSCMVFNKYKCISLLGVEVDVNNWICPTVNVLVGNKSKWTRITWISC